MATGGSRYTPEILNFAKLSACIIGSCTRMMRELLLKHVHPSNLRSLVNSNLQIQGRLNLDQKKKLAVGTVPDYEKFDVTLLYQLLRTPGICTPNIPPPTNSWGRPPLSPLQTTIGDDLERIRLMKNHICSHTGKPELDLPEFNQRVSQIKDIAGRFDGILTPSDAFITEIEEMINQSLEPETVDTYLEKVEQLSIQDKEVKETLTEIKGQIKDVDDRQSRKIDAAERNISSQIHDVDTRHTEAIDGAERNISSQIHDADTRHTEAIDSAERNISSQIHDADTRHTDAIDAAERNISSQIHDADTRHTEAIEVAERNLSSQIQTLYTRHRTASENIEKKLIKLRLPKDKQQRQRLIELSRRKVERIISQTDFIKISGYKTVLSKLSKDGYAVITGIPGDGKSTLAVHIIHDIVNDKIRNIKGKQPLIISEPSQWENTVNPSENLIIFVDDMFGTDEVKYFSEWKCVVDEVEDICSDRTDPRRNFLIIALRLDVLNGCPLSIKKHKIFQSLCNLRDEKNFTKKEKLEFLKKISTEKPITTEDGDKIIDRTKHLGFPQCCHLFKTDENLKERGIEFFYEPVAFLKIQLRKLWDNEEIKFAVLALVLLNGGRIFKEEFCSSSNNEKLTHICSEKIAGKSLKTYVEAARSLDGTYLSNENGTFVFMHDSVQHAVATVIWENNSTEVIKHCSFEFLPILCTQATQNQQTDPIVVPKPCFPTLMKRIVAELSLAKSDIYKTVANINIWRDEDICTGMNTLLLSEQPQPIDLNKEDENSKSLLFHAVGARNVSLLKYLIGHAPSDQQKYNAMNHACQVGDFEVFDICQKFNVQTTLEILFSSVKGGNEKIFKQLIEKGFNMESKYESMKLKISTTLLQEICVQGKLNLLQISILNIGKDNFLSLAREQELLHFAAIGGCVVTLECLIKYGMDVYHKDRDRGASILYYACVHGNLDAVKQLEKIPNIVKMNDKYDYTPLHGVAMGTGSVDVAAYLTDKGVDIYAKDVDSRTVIHTASYKGHLNLLKFLHERDSTMIKLLDKDNCTTLHHVALGKEFVDVAAYLIDKGVDVYAKDANGLTVFHTASYKGHLNFLKFLHERDSKMIKLLDKCNHTPLHYVAMGTGSVDVAAYLIDIGVDVYAKDANGLTVFHTASYKGHLNLLKFLHERDSTMIKLLDKDNHTPLHYVAMGTGSVDVAAYLIDKGVDVYAKDANGLTVFHTASYKGHLNFLKFLHERDSKMIKLLDKYNHTPLHYVAMGTGSVDVAAYLIDKGVYAKDANGLTVFHTASYKGHLNLLKFLHERDSKMIKLLDKYNHTPLHYVAMGTGSVDVAAYLIDKGVDVYAKDANGLTVFHTASYQGHLNLLKFLHERDSTMIKLLDKYNHTSLHHVAMGTGSVDVAAYLIDKGVDVYAKDVDGSTVFHTASYKGHLNLLKFLHERDSTMIKLLDKYNRTSLHHVALGKESVDVAAYLIDKGVDVYAKDVDGSTVFHTASCKGHLSLLKFLHERDSTMIKLLDKYNHTPLHYVALDKESVDVAAYLIDKGVDVYAKDANGLTVFHTASYKGHLNFLKFLHERDSTMIKLLDKDNHTPLYYVALGTGSVDVAAYLIDKGVDVYAKDANGETVFHTASYKGHLNLLKFLHERDSTMIKLLDKDNFTTLHHVALGTGSVDVAAYLIDKGVDVYAKDANGLTVFHTASYQGQLNLLKFLHERDSTMIKLLNKYNHTPLHYVALGKESVDVAAYLIDKGVDVYAKDANGLTVFHTASYQGQLNLLKFLHERDSTMIKLLNKYNHTPLHYVALGKESVDVAAYLIDKGVDVYAKDANGLTVFHTASYQGQLNLLKFLHERDSTMIKLLDKDNHTPLHYVAMGTGSVDVAAYLIDKGVDVYAKDANGLTVFHTASYKGHLNLLKFLHERDSKMIKLLDKYNHTPLHYVAMGTGSVDVAAYLIDKGVDVYAKDANSRTMDTRSLDVAFFIISKLINAIAKSIQGKTALHIAKDNSNTELLNYLKDKFY